MHAPVLSAATATAAPRPELVVATALVGAFIGNMTAQFAGTNLADIQGGVGASADEVSWLTTIYTATSFLGVVLAPALVRTLGLRRLFLISAVVFAMCAWLSAMATSLPLLLTARALQGVAGGTFGPMAFVTVFLTWKGPRLSFGLALLAFSLLVSVNSGPVAAGPIEAAFGWRALFVVQFLAAIGLAFMGARWLPPATPINREGLRTDWAAIALLALAMGLLTLVVGQGARRFWLDSSILAWATSVCVGSGIGFAILYSYSPLRILNGGKLLDRQFGIPVLLNMVFRASFAVSVYLIPLLLGLTQSYRPLQTSYTLLWCLIPQIAAFPVVWRLMHYLDGRLLMLLGLLVYALGIALMAESTSQVASEQLMVSLVLIGIGQMMFLVPTLLIGASSVKPEDGPTASVAFNATTIGGTALGVGLISHFTIEREKFHSNILVDNVSWLNPQHADRLSSLADLWTTRLSDDAAATARSVAQVSASVRREAWLLAINDSMLLVAAVLVIAALAIAFIGPSPPLSFPHQRDDP